MQRCPPSLTSPLSNHGFEQAAANELASATGLTALELLRHVPSLPMNFFDFHLGVDAIAALTRLRRLKLNDARFICQGSDASWDPLTRLSSLESFVLSGPPPHLAVSLTSPAPVGQRGR